MKRHIFTCAMAIYLPATLLPTQTVAADLPSLFSVFPEAKIETQEQRHYIPYPLITGMGGKVYSVTDVGGVLDRKSTGLNSSHLG